MPISRELSITYGSYVAGGSETTQLLDGTRPYEVERGYGTTTVRYDILIVASSVANFATAVASIEAAFTKPRQALTITQGASTILSLSHSSNTGMNAAPRIEKRREVVSGLSRLCTVAITFETPADLTGQSGRFDSKVALFFSPSTKRTLVITGTYTALSSNGARAQYNAAIGTYASTLTTDFTGTWELTDEDATTDDTDKRCFFRRVYEEILLGQSSSGTDDSDIFRQTLIVTRGREAPGDTPGSGAQRLTELTIRYDAWVVKTNTALETKWRGTIRPWLISHAASVSGTSSAALVSENPVFDRVENKISATLVLLTSSGGALISHELVTEDADAPGMIFVPVWNGDPLARFAVPGPQTKTRTTIIATRTFGGSTTTTTGGQGVTGGNEQFGQGGNVFAGGGGSGPGAFGGPIVPTGSAASDLFKLGLFRPSGGSGGSGGGGSTAGGGSSEGIPIFSFTRVTPRRFGLPEAGTVIDVTDTLTLTRTQIVKIVGSAGTSVAPTVGSTSAR